MSATLLHKIAFGAYNLGWCIALPFLRRHHRLAEGYRQRILKGDPPGSADIWIQAASVGEAFLALEILNFLGPKVPVRFLLTANTSQGVEILKRNLQKQDAVENRYQPVVRYFPFDKPSLMAAAVARIRPKLMILLETEIWPGLLQALKRNGSKSLIVNGRIAPRSLRRYLLWPSIWRNLRPDKILAISRADADRFGRLFGTDGIEVVHNIKFDRIHPSSDTSGNDHKELKIILATGAPFVILASIRGDEEAAIMNVIRRLKSSRPETIIGLFPRHMHRVTFWQKSLSQLKIGWSLRSAVSGPVPVGTVIVWDTFGELMSAYRLACSAFVGGSLAPLGGQNFLEALINGVVPVIGPFWENFHWVGRDAIDAGLLRIADDWQEVAAFILQDIDNPRTRSEVIEAAQGYLKIHKGGTAQACRRIEEMLEKAD